MRSSVELDLALVPPSVLSMPFDLMRHDRWCGLTAGRTKLIPNESGCYVTAGACGAGTDGTSRAFQ